MRKARSKYGSKKVVVDGITFDSKAEARYYKHLKRLQANDQILFFRTQPRYLLQEAFTKNGVLHEKIEYAADFEVHHKDGSIEVIDIREAETEAFKIKRKLFEKKYPHTLSLLTYSPDHEGFLPTKEYRVYVRKKMKMRGRKRVKDIH
ncbi:DUF1064 domain-containing protein [Bacillus badius]|uniref:DUF1064 domain-containing protein n=1 Tax=Bacillus badius TaxID=1455 RepID=A0ABR5AY10_BACBA|nr:DUF1064 domain-containing protein [Bacillus badius]KIL79098.1 hypothetical protein SD77_3899 [Bacillus badius]MED4715477.1 DUF1064 domain-containing protein [Bacillus badius]